MKCDEAGEFISVLMDGGRIPKDAAEHIGDCTDCSGRMGDYAQIGAELRRVASMTEAGELGRARWAAEVPMRSPWWFGLTKRTAIPRFALASLLMIAVVAALSTGLLLVRAQNDARTLDLRIQMPDGVVLGQNMHIATDPNSKWNAAGFLTKTSGGWLGCTIRMIGVENGVAKLGIRAKWYSFAADVAPDRGSNAVNFLNARATSPAAEAEENQYSIVPGEQLTIPVEGMGSFQISGQFSTDSPTTIVRERTWSNLEPTELRLESPVLLREGRLVFDGEGIRSSAFSDKKTAIDIYIPGEGLYVVSPTSFPGAVSGQVNGTQITFTIDGDNYLLLSGGPILADSQGQAWIYRDPNRKVSVGGGTDHGAVFVSPVGKIAEPSKR